MLPRLHTLAASISASKVFFLSRATCCRCLRHGAASFACVALVCRLLQLSKSAYSACSVVLMSLTGILWA